MPRKGRPFWKCNLAPACMWPELPRRNPARSPCDRAAVWPWREYLSGTDATKTSVTITSLLSYSSIRRRTSPSCRSRRGGRCRGFSSWWAVLLVILTFTVIWNTQLRRLVEQRTDQLQHEIHERERVERQHALEAERSRIARDLHDDLGSSLTEISVLASSGQLRQTSADHQPGLFQAIGAKARGLISALDVIVWAVDPEDNSLQSLADYLSGYADDFFSHTNIDCRFKVPVSFPPVTLEGRLRHELLMAVKEGINNIVRHSEATEVEFRMGMADACLEIVVADNGKGIEHEIEGNGHGLKNLSSRLEKIGGICTVRVTLRWRDNCQIPTCRSRQPDMQTLTNQTDNRYDVCRIPHWCSQGRMSLIWRRGNASGKKAACQHNYHKTAERDLMTKVAIVEDNATLRKYLAGLVGSTPHHKCVCACESAEEAMLEIPKASPQRGANGHPSSWRIWHRLHGAIAGKNSRLCRSSC